MEVSFALKTAIELAQNGNKSSFEFIYKETFSFAWYRASIITHNNQHLTADIVQDAYVICYKQISTLENIEAFYAWFGSIIYHLSMQYFRKQKREFSVDHSSYDWDSFVSPSEIRNNPELSSQETATKEIVMELIDTLPELQKLTLIAHYYDGLKIEQIAKSMDCPESTVKSRLNYARTSLKTAIERLERTHGYRIHSIGFPIIYTALRDLIANNTTSDELKSALYNEFLMKLQMKFSINQRSINQENQFFEDENDSLVHSNHTSAISAVLDSSSTITASLGLSAALTSSLDATDIDSLDTFSFIHIDFATLIASLKTKFAIASAATAIGNHEIMLLENFELPKTNSYVIEAILTSSLIIYDDILSPATDIDK